MNRAQGAQTMDLAQYNRPAHVDPAALARYWEDRAALAPTAQTQAAMIRLADRWRSRVPQSEQGGVVPGGGLGSPQALKR